MEKLRNFETREIVGSLCSKISTEQKKQVYENRVYIEKLLKILLYLAKQGIAFRGHDESNVSNNQGNFLELCNLISNFDQSFQNKLETNFNMCSHDIQN